MRIKEVEESIGITRKNIRFYEKEGLLSPKRNCENGYREYSKDDIKRLKEIKLFRKVGVPIEDIRLLQSEEVVFNAQIIVKASMGASPMVNEYLQSLFPDVDFVNERNAIGSIPINEVMNIHDEIVEAINR